ncbi:tumor necrosis factor receptor superfamily member 4-like [Stylophora pistillata]|uniref:tumor necrosis factor receptor superfamily member 4-like n=1 Tax=Stylophora pistillata TaxID=50429 RepID=UPI000C048E20|nr:tumor necrosis factor receptor superfamily member 4-like [Stylophora pistillata]
MQTIQSLFLPWIMVFLVEGQSPNVPCSLTQNFVKFSPSGKFAGCRPCPECPEGHGLNIQCGSSILEDTKIRCVPCENIKTYSNSHGVESCKPCQECGLLNVLQECTTERNRKCGHKCPKGYFYDGRITGCRETTPATVTTTTLSMEPSPSIWPTSTSTSTVSSIPNIESTHSKLMSVLSAETLGSIEVPLVVENHSSTSVESTPSVIPQPSSLYRGTTSTSIPGNMEVSLPGRNEAAATVLVTMLVTIVLIVILTPTAIVCRNKCRMSKKRRPKQKGRIKLE